MTTFIKAFSNSTDAYEFAATVMGIVSIYYGWDDMLNKITREYVVKY